MSRGQKTSHSIVMQKKFKCEKLNIPDLKKVVEEKKPISFEKAFVTISTSNCQMRPLMCSCTGNGSFASLPLTGVDQPPAFLTFLDEDCGQSPLLGISAFDQH